MNSPEAVSQGSSDHSDGELVDQVLGLSAGVAQTRTIVVQLKVRHLRQDFLRSETVCEKIEYVDDANTRSTDAGVPAALLRIDSDALRQRWQSCSPSDLLIPNRACGQRHRQGGAECLRA